MGLQCCAVFSLIMESEGYSLVVLCWLLIMVAFSVVEYRPEGSWVSVVAAHGLSHCGSQALEHRLSSCDTGASLLHSMWELPGSGIEPMSPALKIRFFSFEPSGSPRLHFECDHSHRCWLCKIQNHIFIKAALAKFICSKASWMRIYVSFHTRND